MAATPIESKQTSQEIVADWGKDHIIDLAKENGDTCMICYKAIGIMVTPNRSCECRQLACLHCFRDYLGLNQEPHRIDKTLQKCMLKCGKPYRGSPPYTVADLVDLGKLDRAYGTIGCPRDCGWIGSRCEFQKKHKHECKQIRGPCKICGSIVIPAEHTVKCEGCNIEYLKCDMESHISVCTAPRGLCGNLLSKHDKVKCAGCQADVHVCSRCTTDSHSASCVLMIPVREMEFKALYITLDEAKLTDQVCDRCGLVKGIGHIEMCITFIHMMEKMGIETPYSKTKEALGRRREE